MGKIAIRRIGPDERVKLSLPIQSYAFRASPASRDELVGLTATQRFYECHTTLLAEEDGVPVADASVVPMRQNVRGTMYPMAGVAGVATLPVARRKGIARSLVLALLDQMREGGSVVSALYPFRPSFYEKFGFVGLPAMRTASFAPSDLAGLIRAELGGDVVCERAGVGYDTYRVFTLKLAEQRHGFAVLPDTRAVEMRDTDDCWVATARLHGEVIGAATYRITGLGGDLTVSDFLTTGPLSRALLLQFFARHVDQVAKIVVPVSLDEAPELWVTDLAVQIEGRTSFPEPAAPMARVLALEGLAGMACGPGRVVIDVVDDPFIAGRYLLDGRSGQLVVNRQPHSEPDSTLTVPGLSGLVYGVLDPEEVVVRRFGTMAAHAVSQLRTLFPRVTPFVFAHF
ncbi:Predicted acetyltransferase [Frankia canadensis]|uniref:Predicted acetyltransferase n=1 Tax=Frankia canadensis TaxID=1836972 RepID=A0A2I2KJA8_9ACTN|nr:GNAT family N-acetyltransferase [Frankia canadensis]SNQ45759.1 Predicted acetyltransferase [Frankia canadensis]SOU53049.1 Predicted acetyltransferase [Frankia canadensis]